MIKIINDARCKYLLIGPIFHKMMEIGGQKMKFPHFDFSCKLSLTGKSHAGLAVSAHSRSVLLELNVYETRHWDYVKGEWK